LSKDLPFRSVTLELDRLLPSLLLELIALNAGGRKGGMRQGYIIMDQIQKEAKEDMLQVRSFLQ